MSHDAGTTGFNQVIEMYGPVTGPWKYKIYFPNNSAVNTQVVPSTGDPVGTRHISCNVSDPDIVLGSWHLIERYSKLSTSLNSQDGIIRIWVDNVLVMNHTNVNYPQEPFEEFQFAPTWGGNSGDIKTQTDYFDYDHVRLSDPSTAGGDVTPPTLSSATAGTPHSTGTNGAGVTTNEGNGTLYWAVVTNAGSATNAQIKAGSGGNIVSGKAGSQSISSTGPKTIPGITGLSSSTTYQIKFLHTDSSANDSTQASISLTTTAADVTPPTLSSANAGTQTATGTVGATVSTNEANGTLYWAVVTNGGSVTDAQLKAGTGGSIVSGKAGNQSVTGTGTQTLPNITGLSSGTTYQIKYLQRDMAGNDSSQVSVSFTTNAQGTTQFFSEPFNDNNFASRDWFDTTTGTIDTVVFSPDSGNSSIRVNWNSSGQTPVVDPPKRKGFTATETVFVSMRVKFGTSGIPWQGSGLGYHPHLFMILSDADDEWGGPSANYLNVYLEAGSVIANNSKPRILIQDNLRINTSNINVNLLGTATPHSVAGYNGHQDQTSPTNVDTYFDGDYHNYTQWDGGNVLLNNTWHFLEFYAAMNSVSAGVPVADGILKLWVDSNLIINKTNVYLRTAQFATQKFKTFIFAPYIGDGSPITQAMWVDNLKVLDAREDIQTAFAVQRSRRMISLV